jgi:hypothetical protein
MNDAEITHADHIFFFKKWLISHPEDSDRILEDIYPGIADPRSVILSTGDGLPSFSPAIIKYISQLKGSSFFPDDRLVFLASATVKVVICIAVEEEPDISFAELLFIIRSAIHDFTETYLNMGEDDFEVAYEWIAPELRQYNQSK